MITKIKQFITDERGASAVEYGLLVALIAAVIVAIVASVGEKVELGFQKVDNELPTE